ncbi:MAG: hypothetical protein KUG77_27450 [Nannocystaceae bacterium]|nr:hypothetical protein [Nannocystaceae bacterium]
MSARSRSRSLSAALLWSVLAVASSISLGLGLGAGAFSLPYGLTAGALFGLILGAIGALRQVTGKTRSDLAGLSRRDVAFAGSFAVVAAAGCCIL